MTWHLHSIMYLHLHIHKGLQRKTPKKKSETVPHNARERIFQCHHEARSLVKTLLSLGYAKTVYCFKR